MSESESTFDAPEFSRAAVAESLGTVEATEPAVSTPAPEVEQKQPADDSSRAAIAKEMGKSDRSQASDTAPPEPEPEPEPSGALKAPQSWTAAEREEFARATPALQKAALRREVQISRALNEIAEERRFGGGFREAVAPYEPLFREAGVSASQAVGHLLQQFSQLYTAPLEVRAQILGETIRNAIGKDEAAINLLAAAIENGPAPSAPRPAQPQYNPEQIAQAARQQVIEQYAQAHRQEAAQTIRQFVATRPEHLQAVGSELTALIRAEEVRGISRFSMGEIRELYDRACWANPQVRAIELQKKEAKAAMTANETTRKSRESAVSVKTNPAGPSVSPPLGDEWSDHLRASMNRAGIE